MTQNGQQGKVGPNTVTELANERRLSERFLREELGVKDIPGGGIAIPYWDFDGSGLFTRERGVPGRPRFDQPAGVALKPYGCWRIDQARKAGVLNLVEGESDCWA